MHRAFNGIDGFNVYISPSTAASRSKTYGEILPEGMDKLCNKVKFTKDDYFVDLGSGVGKMTMRVFLSVPSGVKSRGIEICRQRHDLAMIARSRLKHRGIRNLKFAHDDIQNFNNWSKATVVYANVLSFEPKLKEFVLKNLLTHDTLRCVILAGFYPTSPLPSWRVLRVEETIIPMT